MSQAPPQSPPQAPVTESITLSNVSWEDYTRFLKLFAERPKYRLTYDQGELEIMSPLFRHDGDGRRLGRFIVAMTEELGLEVIEGGSTTLRRRKKRRGIEADECYWIANAHKVAGVRELNLKRDPPPDLAVEVDVTNSSLDRLGIAATLGIPEVWRLEGDVLTFRVLQANGEYAVATHSLSFPFLTPDDLMPFVQQARQAPGNNAVVASFRTWLRQRLTSQNP